MPHKGNVDPEVKIMAVEDYLSGRKSYSQALREVGVTDYTLRVLGKSSK